MDTQLYSHTSKSLIEKHSVIIAKHRTSVSVEQAYWIILKGIAKARDITLSDLLGIIDDERTHDNLSSAIRLYVLEYLKAELAKAQKEAGLIVAL